MNRAGHVTVDEFISLLSALPEEQRRLPIGFFDEIWWEEVDRVVEITNDEGQQVMELVRVGELPTP